MNRFAGFTDGKDPDDLHGETVVFELVIQIRRNGCMSVAGSINDCEYAKIVLESAKDSLDTYHARKRLGMETLFIPAHDTAIIGTPQEKKLLAARDDLANAMGG